MNAAARHQRLNATYIPLSNLIEKIRDDGHGDMGSRRRTVRRLGSCACACTKNAAVHCLTAHEISLKSLVVERLFFKDACKVEKVLYGHAFLL